MTAGQMLWKEFRWHCERQGWSISGLAAELGISRRTLAAHMFLATPILKTRAQEILMLVGWPVSQWPRVSSS